MRASCTDQARPGWGHRSQGAPSCAHTRTATVSVCRRPPTSASLRRQPFLSLPGLGYRAAEGSPWEVPPMPAAGWGHPTPICLGVGSRAGTAVGCTLPVQDHTETNEKQSQERTRLVSRAERCRVGGWVCTPRGRWALLCAPVSLCVTWRGKGPPRGARAAPHQFLASSRYRGPRNLLSISASSTPQGDPRPARDAQAHRDAPPRAGGAEGRTGARGRCARRPGRHCLTSGAGWKALRTQVVMDGPGGGSGGGPAAAGMPAPNGLRRSEWSPAA